MEILKSGLSWVLANWAIVAVSIYTVLRFIESGMKTGKWDIVSLIKEFCTLG
jgi:hypothetical protein